MTSSAKVHVIFGSSLAALVLAERLSACNRKVILLNPGRSWGGIFSGLPIGSRIFDAGMTNFEFELFGEPCEDIDAYDPDRRADSARYVGFVRAYVELFAKLHAVPTPQMILGNGRYHDLIITNEFDVLHALPPALQARVQYELESIVHNPNALHPRGKALPGSCFEERSFETVSIANHGETLHRTFIEPMFSKVLGVSSREVPGLFHRSGWAPLFYPETLLSQFGPSPQRLKPTVFHYPDGAHFGAFIGRIVEAVRASPAVGIVEGVSGIRIDSASRRLMTDQGDFRFDHLAWGGDLQQLAASALEPSLYNTVSLPKYPRASLELVFLEVRREGLANPSAVLIDPEPSSPFYRVTDQTACGLRDAATHQIILECNSKFLNAGSESLDEKISTALVRYEIDTGAVVSMSHRYFADALSIPSMEQMHQFDNTRDAIHSALPGITLIGPSSGYVSTTLNDHVIQALKCAQQWEGST